MFWWRGRGRAQEQLHMEHRVLVVGGETAGRAVLGPGADEDSRKKKAGSEEKRKKEKTEKNEKRKKKKELRQVGVPRIAH